MKSKVLTALLISILASGIGLYMLLTRRTAEDHLADADRYVAKGQYGRAGHEYEAAIGKGRGDIETLLKFIDVMGQARVQSAEQARQLLRKMLSAAATACRESPVGQRVLQRYMDLQVYCAVELNITAVWRQIHASADQILKAEPDMLLARKYRGMALVRLADMESSMDHGAGEDLHKYLKSTPDDVEAIHHLAWWHILEAQRRDARGETESARQLRSSGLRIAASVCQRLPASTRAHLNHVRILLAAGQRDQAFAMLREQERKLIKNSSSPFDMLLLVELIPQTVQRDSKEAMEAAYVRILVVCAAMSEAFPKDARADVIKARVLAAREQSDQAIALLTDIRQRQIKGDPLTVLAQGSAHREALISQITLGLDKASDMIDPKGRDQILAGVEDLIDEAGTEVKNTAIYPQLVGRFLALRGKWFAAIESLRKADEILKGADKTVRIQLAVALKQTGQREEAVSILEDLMNAQDPVDLASAGDLLVRLKLEQGAHEDAAQWIERLQAAQVESGQVKSLKMALAKVLMAHGDQERQRGRPDEAIESLSRVLTLAPRNLAVRHNLAAVYRTMGQYDAALEQLKIAYEFAPQDRLMRNLYARHEARHGDKKTAMELRRQWAESDPDDLENQSDLVKLLSSMNQYDEALRVLDTMAAAGGGGLATALLRGQVAVDRGDTADGRRILEGYLKERGKEANAEDWIALARFLKAHGETGKALNAAQQAVRLAESGSTMAALELVKILIQLDRLEEAESQISELYETSPGDRAVLKMLLRVLVLHNRPDDAQKVLDRLVKEHGSDLQTYLMESNIAILRSDIPKAIERLDIALRLAPQNPEIHFAIGRLLADVKGREVAGRDALKHALQLDPAMTKAQILLARLLANAGQMGQAIAELKAALETDERLDEARRHLSELYLQGNHNEEARALLTESARMFSDAPHWPTKLAELAQRMNNFDETATQLKRVFELETSSANLLAAAAALNQAGRYSESLDLLDLNAELIEIDRMLNSVRGWALSGLGRSEESQRAFDKTVNVCRTLPQAAMVADHMVRALGRDKAITRIAALMHPQNEVVVGITLATLELRGGKAVSGLNRLKRIKSKMPENSPHRGVLDRQLAMALHATKEREAIREEAVKQIEAIEQ